MLTVAGLSNVGIPLGSPIARLGTPHAHPRAPPEHQES
jgi:hypothetical protein